jgi:acetyl-CoA carboxylase biotin carboxylase subunit
VAEAGLTFVGPPPEAIEAMGEKTAARRRMQAAGVPVVPGSDGAVEDAAEARALAARLGYPVMIKAAAGGGGRGLKRCDGPEQFEALWDSAGREAAAAFGDGRRYLEKVLARPRHVEVQVFCDAHGGAVHLGERECSVQRRHQKLIEETPSPAVDGPLREAMGAAALRAATAVGYRGAGTVEFLLDAGGAFHFLEMNTRLQVEHPVTELVTGLDLVRLQLEVAAGGPVPAQAEVRRRGHAVEARICAEDPAKGFLPRPGTITAFEAPAGEGLRLDPGVAAGAVVSPHYDSLLAKLCAWAPSREEALSRLAAGLDALLVEGVPTTAAWLAAALRHPALLAGDYDTGFVEQHGKALAAALAAGRARA